MVAVRQLPGRGGNTVAILRIGARKAARTDFDFVAGGVAVRRTLLQAFMR